MDLNRKFQHEVNGNTVEFDVTYNPQTHFFDVFESGQREGYLLKFDMQTRKWSIDGSDSAQLPADELAILVQKSFGHFV